ncbi:MAG: hypothetical protein WBL44_16010, partial [Nitrososphaeraceae archaeon]
KRGQQKHVLSNRRTGEERIHLTKLGSKPVEHALGNLIVDLYERKWLNDVADLLVRSLEDGSWNSVTVQVQESILEKIAEMKARVDLRRKRQEDEEMKFAEWDVTIAENENDTPFFELAAKLSKPYRNEDTATDKRIPTTFNPAKEILRYRRIGDPLRHTDVSVARQIRALMKHPPFLKEINDGRFSLIQKGSQLFNRYREPFSNARWMYTWAEWFWIVLYAHVVSTREAARMISALDGQSMRKLSSKRIKNQIEPVIYFWQDFFEYVPHYLAYLNEIESLTKNDPELCKIGELESEESDRIEMKAIQDLIRIHSPECLCLEISHNEDSYARRGSELTDQRFEIHRVIKVGKEMIRVCHPNPNYKREMDEFRKGLRTKKPQRKTSSCYFDPWKQKLEVLAALVKKGKIDVGKLGFTVNPHTDHERLFSKSCKCY